MLFILRTRRQLPSNEAGFGMIELLIAMSIMSIGILAVFALFQTGMVTIRRASTISTAAALADSEIEKFRALKYTVVGLDDSEVATAGAIAFYSLQKGLNNPERPDLCVSPVPGLVLSPER